jgi:hypothetical protein
MQSLELAFLVAEELGEHQRRAEEVAEADAAVQSLETVEAAPGAADVGHERAGAHAVAGRHRAPIDGFVHS